MNAALSGVRVLDLSSHVAGPYCTKLLADFGAEVIKVEPPAGGDGARRIGASPGGDASPAVSALFLHLNTNKRSVTLDITHEAGASVLRRLIASADVVVDDGALPTAAGGGWDYDSLSLAHPALVMTSLSPFGPDGPYSGYRADELILSAMGGWMFPMGDPDRPPLQPGGPYVLYVAGLWAAAGTLTALFGARASGLGEHVHIPMLEGVAATTVEDMVRHSYTGEERGRHGHRWGAAVMNSLQPAGDGHTLVMGGPNAAQVFTLLGLTALADEARPQGDALEDAIRSFTQERTREELFHAAQSLRLPFAPVASPDEILRSPQLAVRDYFVEVSHPEAGALRYTGAPYRMRETPGGPERAAPLLGQDNDEVYGGLVGLGGDALADLRARRVI